MAISKKKTRAASMKMKKVRRSANVTTLSPALQKMWREHVKFTTGTLKQSKKDAHRWADRAVKVLQMSEPELAAK